MAAVVGASLLPAFMAPAIASAALAAAAKILAERKRASAEKQSESSKEAGKAENSLLETLKSPLLEAFTQAELHIASKEFRQAEQALLKTLPLAESSGDLKAQATIWCWLGLVFEHMGKLTQAAERHERALALDEKAGHQTGILNHLYNLGRISLELGDSAKGYQYLHRARILAMQSGNKELRENINRLLKDG
jgi:tetratricopeptide (TPR) repeat protein